MADALILDYIPIDRYLAMSQGIALPSKTRGAALFADISGFTPLTEALTRTLGARRGAEELTHQLNRVYDALIGEVNRYRGSVISFSGDAITCWFDDETPEASARATACGLAMQTAMQEFSSLTLPNGETVSLAMKAAIASGNARRFLVGDPTIQRIDALGGQTIIRMATAEHHANKGEVVIDSATAEQLADQIELGEWRDDEESYDRFAVVIRLTRAVEPNPWPAIDPQAVDDAQVRPWLLPPVYERLQAGMGEFLTELRPAVVFFLRFEGIDYEADESAEEKLDALMHRVQAIIAHYDGAVLQLTIGDKGSYLYGSFGAPVAHENDHWRAITAALELRGLWQELAFIKPLQIGISRGSLRTGAYGGTSRRTYGVLGDDVNLAARLMQAAPSGEVFVSEQAQQPVSKQFAWESLTPIRVKGKSEPIRVFRLVGTGEEAGINLQEPTYALPMIGRETELNLISEKLDLAMQGHGQIVGVIADAGMGKSRLLGEFIRLGRLRGIPIYGGECQSYGTNTSYLVWQPLLRGFFGLGAAQTLDEQRAVLEHEIEQVDPALLPRLPLLGLVLDLALPDNDFTRTLEPQLRKTALEGLILDVLHARVRQAKAQNSVVVLVLEDMHWIDPASSDLLELIARASQDWALMIALAYRPTEQADQPAHRLEALPQFTQIPLTQLSAEEINRLAQVKLEQLGFDTASSTLLQRVLQRAEGNPFYVEELLNYLHDKGLTLDDAEELELPSSLHSLILSRIDQLSERQKITLKVASIIGRMFHLARLYGYYPALGEFHQLKADLEHLSDIEITPLDQPEPEVIYLFKHILTQEVAYESLAYSTRATLHERFAAYLETGNVDQSLDLIAYHYGRTDNVPKKRDYFRRAGEAAAKRYANAEAVEYFSRALELSNGQAAHERYSLYILREEVLHNLASREAQAQDLATLESLAEGLQDKQLQAQVALRRTKYLKALSNFPNAISTAQQAIEWAAAANARETEAEGFLEWGQTLSFQGNFAEAQTQLNQALAKSTDFPRLEGYALRNLGMVAIRQGRFPEARGHYDRAIARFRELGDRRGEGQSRGDVGNLFFFQGQFAEARESFVQALSLFREIGLRSFVGSMLNNLGAMDYESGNYAQAQANVNEALTLARQIGQRHLVAQTLSNLGFYALAPGEYEAAEAYFEQGLTLARELADRQQEGVLLNNLGVALAAQGDYDEARSAYEQSLALKRDTGDRVGESETLAFLALLHYEVGDNQAAHDNSQQALTIAQEVGAGLEEARASHILGHALAGLGRVDEATSAYHHALERRREIGQHHLAVEPLAGLAQLALGRADVTSALASARTILDHLETQPADGLEEPGRVYLTCYRILQQAQDGETQRVLETAYNFLQQRAAKIATESRRTSFLGNVPPHRNIVAAMEATQ